MNYYSALEVRKEGKPTGTFHFTRENDGEVYPVGYCAEGNCNHTSKEEASDCYRKYCKEKQHGMMAGSPMPENEKWGTPLIIASSY